MLKRLHPHVTPIATTITERLFDVHKFTLEWSSDAIVDGAYKSEAFVYLSEHLRDFHTWNKFYDDEGGQCLFSLIIEKMKSHWTRYLFCLEMLQCLL